LGIPLAKLPSIASHLPSPVCVLVNTHGDHLWSHPWWSRTHFFPQALVPPPLSPCVSPLFSPEDFSLLPGMGNHTPHPSPPVIPCSAPNFSNPSLLKTLSIFTASTPKSPSIFPWTLSGLKMLLSGNPKEAFEGLQALFLNPLCYPLYLSG